MKKIKKLLFILLTLSFFASCGPRRYKCGPYRRCNVEFKQQNIDLENNIFC
ncbi:MULTISPECIES: hypothetical protein [Flavobacterium]|uniref:Lipoprotein n=1 Tax=Flavobacterium jumunjinense TaxID=998845 RepID=A0ABV5GTQ8_9FLAO|nr:MULTISPECIES: hypothetical protein [Flavobacterium]